MTFDDALFNWLQIQIVADGRPEDNAAADTRDFFVQVLTEDHGISELHIKKTDETMVYISYERNGSVKLQLYPREAAEQLLTDIRSNPKYN
ncbi:MAG: hypothetical protein ACE3L7_12505 [Candidatus Pristimantibacillus sp.]